MKNAKNFLERISDLIYAKNKGLNLPPSLSITIVLLKKKKKNLTMKNEDDCNV